MFTPPMKAMLLVALEVAEDDVAVPVAVPDVAVPGMHCE